MIQQVNVARTERRRAAASKTRCPSCRQLWSLRVVIEDETYLIACNTCETRVATIPRPRRGE